jgi:hypothetical protein
MNEARSWPLEFASVALRSVAAEAEKAGTKSRRSDPTIPLLPRSSSVQSCRRSPLESYLRSSAATSPVAGAGKSARVEAAAYQYLSRAIARQGLQTVASFDALFTRKIPHAGLRQAILDKLGVDIGFDASSECFSSMLAAKLLPSRRRAAGLALCETVTPQFKEMHWQLRYRMFRTPGIFAADTDCSSVALAALYQSGELSGAALVRGALELLKSAASESLSAAQNIDLATGSSNGPLHAGVVMTYWEDGAEPGVKPRGKKHDPAVACNVLFALKLAAHEGLADPAGVIHHTLKYVERHLVSGEYRNGTRYYPSPDVFLCYVAQLCARFDDCRAELGPALLAALRDRNRCAPRPGRPDDPDTALNLAQRILAANLIGVDLGQASQKERLIQLQDPSGAWEPGPLFSLGKRAVYFGSAALTAVFALAALQS